MSFRMPETPAYRRGMAALVILIDLALAGAFLFLAVRGGGGAGNLDPSTLAFTLFPAAGAVIVYRQPRNPVGWLAAALGFLFVLNAVLGIYATQALLTHPGSLPFGAEVAWVNAWLWTLPYPPAVALILRLPDGRLPAPRWKYLLRSILLTTLPVTLLIMVLLWPLRGAQLVMNNGDLSSAGPNGRFIMQLVSAWQPLIILQIALAALALVLRFIRARGIERLQMKWIALAITLVPLNLAFDNLFSNWNDPLVTQVRLVFNLLSIVGFPISIAIATTRYRLYDIDVIIRRTLVYTLLTGVLGLIYLVDVIVLQRIFSAITGEQSPAAVVLSTLLIAALARTLHNRIQSVIDRRFYRRRYNADLALEQFSARLRSNLDLEQVQDQLHSAVDVTLQPEFASLWLVRSEPGRPAE